MVEAEQPQAAGIATTTQPCAYGQVPCHHRFKQFLQTVSDDEQGTFGRRTSAMARAFT